MGRWANAWRALVGRAPSAESVATALIASMSERGRPPRRGTTQLLVAFSSLPRLRAVVDLIARDIAGTPWKLYRPKRGQRGRLSAARRLAAKDRRRSIKTMLEADEMTEIVGHPFAALLESKTKVGPYGLSAFQVRYVTQVHLDLVGEAVRVLERFGSKQPTEWYPIPPDWMKLPSAAQPAFEVRWPGGTVSYLQPEDVLWWRHPDPSNPYGRGSGLGATLNNELDADEFAAQTTAFRFHNNAIPDLLIGIQDAQLDELERAKSKWLAEHQGHKKTGVPHFTNGKVTAQTLSANFVDLDLVEIRRFEAEIVTETFGVPPELVGRLLNSNRATITVADQHYSRHVIAPRLDFLSDAYDDAIKTIYGDDDVVAVPENPIPADWDYELQAGTVAPWAFSIDEWRERGGKPPLPKRAGEVHLVPFGLSPIDFAAGETISAPTTDEDDAEDEAETDNEPLVDDEDEETTNEDADTQDEGDDEGKAVLVLVTKQDPRVTQVLARLEGDRVAGPLTAVFREELLAWVMREIRELGAEQDLAVVEKLVDQHLRRWAGKRIKGDIHETTRSALADTLADGVAAGETMRDLIIRVDDVFDTAASSRAELIARTETNASGNWGIMTGQKLAGITRREWLATLDSRVRDTHAVLDGQVVGIDEPFHVNGMTAMYPGGFGRPSQDCNCRCTTAPLLDERSAKTVDRAARWKRFDEDLSVWEKKSIKALRRGFDVQRSEIRKAVTQIFGTRSVAPTNGVRA